MLSQSAFAVAVGVSLRSVQNWEAGLFVPQGRIFRKICEVLGRTPAYFFPPEPGEIREAAPPYTATFSLDALPLERLKTVAHDLTERLQECSGPDYDKVFASLDQVLAELRRRQTAVNSSPAAPDIPDTSATAHPKAAPAMVLDKPRKGSKQLRLIRAPRAGAPPAAEPADGSSPPPSKKSPPP